ncbi:MAG: DUF1285 domain-containing protein [Myxococcales bacterium]|nr:DUF1285 domain-containing protein [Myxococcales bacterium]
MPPSSKPEMSAAQLERLRQSGLRIDAEGRFWHEGALVEHEGTRRAFSRWLDRLAEPDGRYILRLDETRYAYVDVDDTPLVVRTLRWIEPDPRPLLSLSDGTEERLDPASLTFDDGGVLRTWVRAGRLEARLSTAATSALAAVIDMHGDEPVLRLPGQARHPLRRRQR